MGERVGGRAWRVFPSLSAPGRPATPRGQSPGSPVSTGTSGVLRSRARSPARGPRLQGPPLPEGRRSAAESDAVTFWRAASSFTGDIKPRLPKEHSAMQLLCLGYPDRGSPGRKESGPTTAPIGGYAPGPISGPITDGKEKHPSSGTHSADYEVRIARSYAPSAT